MGDRSRLRLVVLQALVFSLLLTLVGRLWYMQVVAYTEFQAKATSITQVPVVTAAVRGQILDAQGRPLVTNRTAMVVTVDNSVLRTLDDDGESVLRELATMLDMPYDELRNRVTPCGEEGAEPGCWTGYPFVPVPVSLETDDGIAQLLFERGEEFPGVTVEPRPVRHYTKPAGANAAHMLGYLQPITEEELEDPNYLHYKDLKNALIGRTGLERVYEGWLAGVPGVRTLERDVRGQIIGTVSETEPQSGHNVVLSIDAQVQAAAEKRLAAMVKADAARVGEDEDHQHAATNGAAVVLDAKTGRVIAMASYPTYDPEVWVGGIARQRYERLNTDPALPLLNQAIQGAYAPGSVFKLATTVAAIRNGDAAFGGTYNCPGSLEVGNSTKRNYEGRSLGRVSLHQVLVESCDTTYYQWAMNEWYGDERRIDAGEEPLETMQKVAREFGFGSPTGIDLPGERGGTIEDREQKRANWESHWKEFNCAAKDNPELTPYQRLVAKENCESGWVYNIGDAANVSIGQGTVLTTPLQMAVAYAALANGGTVYEPKLAWGILDGEGTPVRTVKPEVRGRLDVSDSVLEGIRGGMCDVPIEGTARTAFDGFRHDVVRVCGKTGTAEVAGKDDTSWFASFGGPADDPNRYVVVAVIPNGSTGGTAAAPVVRHIWEAMFGLDGKTPITLASELPRFNDDGTVAQGAPLRKERPLPVCPDDDPFGEGTGEEATDGESAPSKCRPQPDSDGEPDKVDPTPNGDGTDDGTTGDGTEDGNDDGTTGDGVSEEPALTASASPTPGDATLAAGTLLLLGPLLGAARAVRRKTAATRRRREGSRP